MIKDEKQKSVNLPWIRINQTQAKQNQFLLIISLSYSFSQTTIKDEISKILVDILILIFIHELKWNKQDIIWQRFWHFLIKN